MRSYITPSIAALVSLTLALPQGPTKHGDGPGGMAGMSGMSGMAGGLAGGMAGGMGMMNQGTTPAVIKTIEPKFKSATNPQSTRVQLRYGPYTMPSSNDTTVMLMPGMEDESGVVDVMFMGNATKPCSDCTLKYASADLQYTDGTIANLNTGAWLHHMTLSVSGPGRSDFACGNKWKDGERMLVIHNDRNETYYGLNGADNYGYYLSNSDKMSMVLELKNDATIPKNVYFTLTFEYVPGKPKEYKEVKALWLDAQVCGAPSSEIEPPKGKTQFTLSSQDWISPVDGTLLTTVGHMHDGASHLEIYTNGNLVCDSVARYGGDANYEVTAEAVKLGVPKMEHITRYGACSNFGKVKKGDRVGLKAYYDFAKNKPGLGNSGAPTGVMGIALMFLGVD